jgi:polyisoprenoid-binding protein YceI
VNIRQKGKKKNMRALRAGFLSIGAWAVLSLASSLRAAVPLPPQQTTPVAVSEIVLTLDPAQSRLHWTVDSTMHTVHGTFALKSGIVHLDPETGKAGGQIVVFAPSGESGNSSRDRRMHKEILETAKYPDVVFRPTQVEGKVSQSGASDVKLSGVFSIHGADHDLTAQVHAELTGDRWMGTSKFEVPYVEWGIKNPSNFLLKVKPVVIVELEMSGDIKAAK